MNFKGKNLARKTPFLLAKHWLWTPESVTGKIFTFYVKKEYFIEEIDSQWLSQGPGICILSWISLPTPIWDSHPTSDFSIPKYWNLNNYVLAPLLFGQNEGCNPDTYIWNSIVPGYTNCLHKGIGGRHTLKLMNLFTQK